MNVSGINQSSYVERTKREKNNAAGSREDFLNSLSGNLSGGSLQEPEQREDIAARSSRSVEGIYYQSLLSPMGLYHTDHVLSEAVTETEVRDLSYEKTDYVKIDIENGRVYKARVLEETNQVYVEEKREDGTETAYLVDMAAVKADADSGIEQTARRAWEKKQTEGTEAVDEEFRDALQKFYAYAAERVKEGPEKFSIGAAELTIEEWDKLIASVDEQIDAAKQDLRERVEEQTEKEEQDSQRLAQEEKDGLEQLVEKRKWEHETGPYSFLMNEAGEMVYNGVAFTYDKTGALCLGDMSNPDDVLTIYLSDGCFKLNRNNIGELGQAISMFSPEDINRILRAISQDAKCREKLNEIEEAAFAALKTEK